ncbi:hypothetical protein AAJ76_1100007481 [Vairimorpha ceranae]|uniref:Uncharacterized protein n=1 Tax=Vairimorpha ceranae TaxID=40302 RepID=A0A0F9WM61_9MICR|nr:hypothetical protein AAJ76_1100007481 [Vairimorpha ceranae]KKO74153.1 hypothetical protein AAJ76_1100007481 [Vairimorpha ceranae]
MVKDKKSLFFYYIISILKIQFIMILLLYCEYINNSIYCVVTTTLLFAMMLAFVRTELADLI